MWPTRISTMPATSGSIIAYLKDSTSHARITQMEKELRAMGAISKVLYIPRQSGLDKMTQWLGPDSPLVEGVDPRILPDAFEITLKREYADKVAVIASSVGKLAGVDDVRYRKGLIGSIAGSFSRIVFGASVLGAIVVICLALVIFLSIRVGIISRKPEIEVMGMLGANYLFIYAPYLIEAGMYGFHRVNCRPCNNGNRDYLSADPLHLAAGIFTAHGHLPGGHCGIFCMFLQYLRSTISHQEEYRCLGSSSWRFLSWCFFPPGVCKKRIEPFEGAWQKGPGH